MKFTTDLRELIFQIVFMLSELLSYTELSDFNSKLSENSRKTLRGSEEKIKKFISSWLKKRLGSRSTEHRDIRHWYLVTKGWMIITKVILQLLI